MHFFKPKDNWQYHEKEIEELEKIKDNPINFQFIDVDSKLTKGVPTYCWAISEFQKPILATDSLYNCTGILAYDLSKRYAFLGHSFPNQYSEKNKLGLPGASIHILNMLETLSKKELYQLKFVILAGKRPNACMIEAMINTILCLRKKNISIESIELKSTFVKDIHIHNAVNLGGSFAFDVRNGNMITYNPNTHEYYSYNETSSVDIKLR